MDTQQEFNQRLIKETNNKIKILTHDEFKKLYTRYFLEKDEKKKQECKEEVYWALLPIVTRQMHLFNKKCNLDKNIDINDIYYYTAEVLEYLGERHKHQQNFYFNGAISTQVQRCLYRLLLENQPWYEKLNNTNNYREAGFKEYLPYESDSYTEVPLEEAEVYTYDLEDDFSKLDMIVIMYETFNILNKKEKQVLSMRFGLDGEEPKILDEVGKVLGVTKERIRQIEVKALRKIRWEKPLKLRATISDDEADRYIDIKCKSVEKPKPEPVEKPKPKPVKKALTWRTKDPITGKDILVRKTNYMIEKRIPDVDFNKGMYLRSFWSYKTITRPMYLAYDYEKKVWYPIEMEEIKYDKS